MDSLQNPENLIIYYLTVILFISLPGEVKCFDIEQFSSFILYLLVILFILALLGNYSKRKRGYMPINDTIQNSTKL